MGTEFVAKAPPDGYTILCAAAASVVINPAIYAKLRYSIADFAPLSNAASYPFILSVAKSVPAQNLRELIDYIKKNPDKANAGGSTAGHQLMTALFREKTGSPVQYIPYKGMNEVTAALAGDQLMMSFLTAANAGQINSGAVRALAVTSAKRDPRFPNVPTMAEAGVDGFTALSWTGFLAPRDPARDRQQAVGGDCRGAEAARNSRKAPGRQSRSRRQYVRAVRRNDRRRLQDLGCGSEGRKYPDQSIDFRNVQG